MHLTYINELPVLEHDDVIVDIEEDEYEQMQGMNSAQKVSFLWRTVLTRLQKARLRDNEEGDKERILKAWLMDGTIDKSDIKEIHDCGHLLESKLYCVATISGNSSERIASLPNSDTRVLIPKDVFDQIRRRWQDGNAAILDFGSGDVRPSDGVILPSFVRVSEQTAE